MKICLCLVDVVSCHPTAVILSKTTLKVANVLVDLKLKYPVEAVLQRRLRSLITSTTHKVLLHLHPKGVTALVGTHCCIRRYQNVGMRQPNVLNNPEITHTNHHDSQKDTNDDVV